MQTFHEAMKTDKDAAEILRIKWYPDRYESAFSQNTLHADLGYLRQEFPSIYNLDAETRDRLIAHGRQDIALAYATIHNTRTELRKLNRLVVLLCAANLVLLICLILR